MLDYYEINKISNESPFKLVCYFSLIESLITHNPRFENGQSISKQLSNTIYEEEADELIDKIYHELATNNHSFGFEKGLAGVAWGIHFLYDNGFLEGDLDEVLSDIDDLIFQCLSFMEDIESIGLKELVGFGIYLVQRVRWMQNNPDNINLVLFRNLLITIINSIYLKVEKDKAILSEGTSFNLMYGLPMIMIFIASVYKLDFYTKKLDKLVVLISQDVLSTIPSSIGNRLYLLLAIKKISQFKKLEKWEQHANVIFNSIDTDFLFHDELMDKNIHAFSGKIGALFLIKQFNNFPQKDKFSYNEEVVINDIITSGFWNHSNINKLNNTREFLAIPIGIAGIGIGLIVYETDLLNL